MPDALYTLSYFSLNAAKNQTAGELQREIEAILITARRINTQRGITGALLYSAGAFAQVIEGPLSEVEATFERIQLDTRHRNVKVLQFHPINQRNFADWSMAFAGIDPDTPELASLSAALADPREIIAGPDGLDFVTVLRDLIARSEAVS